MGKMKVLHFCPHGKICLVTSGKIHYFPLGKNPSDAHGLREIMLLSENALSKPVVL